MNKIALFIIGIVYCVSSFAMDMRNSSLDLSPAKWIWYPSGRTLQNTFVLFRKDIVLKEKPQNVKGWILADSRYRLFINGVRVQWGPAPSDPRWQEADPVDLTTYFQKGENTIAVEVCFFGTGDGTHPMGKPGFILNLDVDQQKIITDGSWDCFLARSWKPGQYKRWFLRSLQEEFDARLYPYGWDRPAFELNSDWVKAVVVSNDGKYPSVCNNSSEYIWEIFGDKRISEIRKRSVPLMNEFEFSDLRLEESMWIHWKKPVEDYFDMLIPNAFDVIKKPVAKYSDNNGRSFLTAGKGDMLVWASKDDMFGYKKVSFGKDSLVQIKLDIKAGESYFVNMDIVPPVEGKNLPAVTEEQREKNNIRLAEEDAIRNKYISTFMSEDEARKIAESMNIDADKFAEYISKSRGNWKTIKDFMESVPADNRVMAMDLLDVLWEKDLRDVTMDVLNDNLYNTPQSDYRNSKEALLTPRVEYEMLTPYKGFLQKAIPAELAEKIASDPTELVRWCTDSISICNEWNPLGYVISPEGIWKSRIADKRSRNVFFVSAARAMGIPSWIDPVTGKIQYVQNGSVIDVDFESGKQTIAKQGKLMLNYKPLARLKDPKYYIHFTISKIVDGRLKLLGYDDNGTWRGTFKNGVMMDEGNYVLTTGTRLANGSVLSNMTFFNIKEGETTNLDLIIRNDDSEVQVIGNFDSESLYKKADSQETTSVIATTGRGYYVVAVLGAKEEPTNHFLKDLATVSEEFDKWGRSMIMLFPSERNYMNFDITEFEGLPKNITWGLDINRDIANKIISGMELDPAGALPLIIICDTFNRVVFVSQGYNIGTADRMLDVIHKL